MTVMSSHTLACSAGIFPPPAAKQLLTASLDSTLVLWNPSTGQPELKTSVFVPPHAPGMNPNMHGITAMAVHPSGGLVAVGSAYGRIRMIALPRGEVVNTLESHARAESVEALAFVDFLAGGDGGKGVVLVSAGTDGKCYVFDAASGRIRAELRHTEPVTSIAPHPAPAQHLVTTACADRTLRTWDVRTGTLLAEHVGHAGMVNNVVVAPAPGGESPLGLAAPQLIFSAGDEGASLVWRV
jgi:ribosome assembly protein SQT1